MKFKSKIIALFIILTVLTLALCVSASAEAVPEAGVGTGTEESILEGEGAETVPDAEESLPEGEGAPTVSEDGEGETPNFFEELYSSFMEHSEKILGVLTLLGSLILAFAYKKGLLPLIKSSLTALIDTVSKIKDKTQENDAIYKEFSSHLTDRLENAESTLDKLCLHIDALSESLGAAEDVMSENAKLKIIMNAQVDMLYDVFMCSSLPQFQKEAIGERIKEMKEALGGNENE